MWQDTGSGFRRMNKEKVIKLDMPSKLENTEGCKPSCFDVILPYI